MTRSASQSRFLEVEVIRYLFPALAALFLVLGLGAPNPARRKAWLRTAAGFAFGSLIIWWQA